MARRIQKKTDDLDGEYTVITIDQTRKALAAYLTHGWFPEREHPTRDVSGARESLQLLGALTDQGETFFVECESNFTSGVTIQFIQALQQEFGEKIAVVLDHATYFTATVKDFAATTALELIYFPRRSPQLNPSKECWRQFKQFLGNRSFDDFAALRDAMHRALDAINPPNIRNYLLL